jgi:D-glycero-alpha-D-manno-heptose 1-phosphate guanylyltransferase
LPSALSGQLAAFDDTSDFIDIGVPDDYARAQHLFGA